MKDYIKKMEIRWADLDPNFHVLHSKYYDFAAYCRMCFMVEHGINPALMEQLHTGVILLREEAVFKRELRFEDAVSINLKLHKATKDFARWTVVHEIYKNGDTLAAIITVDGAWIDTIKRKLGKPPLEAEVAFSASPKTAEFIFI